MPKYTVALCNSQTPLVGEAEVANNVVVVVVSFYGFQEKN